MVVILTVYSAKTVIDGSSSLREMTLQSDSGMSTKSAAKGTLLSKKVFRSMLQSLIDFRQIDSGRGTTCGSATSAAERGFLAGIRHRWSSRRVH